MSIRSYPILCVLIAALMAACGSQKDREQELKSFLTDWATALTTLDESLPRYYDPAFVFPWAIFNNASEVTYSLNIDQAKIESKENSDELLVALPFSLRYPDNTTEDGVIDLTIIKTKNGFRIRNMSSQLATTLREFNLRQARADYSDLTRQYDSLLTTIRSTANKLRGHYDSVVFFTEVDDQMLFYVVKGSWEFPYDYDAEKQRDGGSYKMGVVTADNNVIIPVAYSKIYNPGGSLKGMIEVENEGARGLFRVTGEEFLPASVDGIYPTNIPGALAQVKKGESYGWVSVDGRVSFDSSSHENKKLFQSPIESQAILGWEFKFPGDIKLLINPYTQVNDANGVIVYPSYIRDMGITSIGTGLIYLEASQYGMGITETEIKFEKVESFSDKFFGLVSFFMESGVDAREFHTEKNDLLVIDKNMKKLSHQEKLIEDYHAQDPCGGNRVSYKSIDRGLYETRNGNVYHYYQVAPEGTIEQLKANRQYNFTKFVKIDETYFDRCTYESVEYDERINVNLVVSQGISTEELDIMRNEIFAEYGFIFKSAKWKSYFESKPWYKPQFENVDQFMTETDKANIKFILEYQQSHKNIQVKRDSINFGWAG